MQRIGVSGSSSNCAFLSVLTAIDYPLVEGKSTTFRDLALDQQLALSLSERKRVARELTQMQLDASFGVAADSDEKGSIPKLEEFRGRLNAPGDVDERALVFLSYLYRHNVFVVRLLVEADESQTQTAVTFQVLGEFDPMRRSIVLYNRMLMQVDEVVSFEDLDADVEARWRKVATTSGHFEVASEADAVVTNWDAESDVVRVSGLLFLL